MNWKKEWKILLRIAVVFVSQGSAMKYLGPKANKQCVGGFGEFQKLDAVGQ